MPEEELLTFTKDELEELIRCAKREGYKDALLDYRGLDDEVQDALNAYVPEAGELGLADTSYDDPSPY